ncbi:MAG: S-methyl-5-thioribose-1-phosphate isomerase [Acidimicrobiales bacterium]
MTNDPAAGGDLPPTVAWVDGRVRIIDQRLLPGELRLVDLVDTAEVVDAIRTLAVRGAPAIGAAGGFAVALGLRAGRPAEGVVAEVVQARPTAVNLAWAAHRVAAAPDPLVAACRIADDDVTTNRRLGGHGATLVGPGASVLTHCNAGHLACVGYGTALGVVRAAHERGDGIHVFVDETRPVLQGARLTAWELQRSGIACTLVADVMAGRLMAGGEVDLVVVGADRIAANGDVANKVGTYGLAVLAHHHGVPFYVAAPASTIDPSTPHGGGIVIEQRAAEEVTEVGGHRIAPDGVAVRNDAFDVTPAALVTAWITEHGVHRHPDDLPSPS